MATRGTWWTFCGMVLALVFLAGCGPANTPTAAPPTPSATAATAAPTETAVPPTEAAPAETPPPATAAGGPIDAEEAEELLYVLSQRSPDAAREAIDRIVAAGDERFTAAFIELYRARQLGLVRNDIAYEEYVAAIEQLNGAAPGDDWFALIEWYGATDLMPPPGFTTWKGSLLRLIDSRFADFLQDDYPARIRPEEIQWGGVPVDGIPPLDNPAMVTADAATYLNPQDAVFGLYVNGEARAYPLRIMDWHEMSNDVIGGVPVSLSYCTLCGAAVAFDGRASDGNTYDFGTSGFLYRSNKLMYDRQTQTLWNQLTGEPVLGELVGTDVALTVLPVVLTTWEAWQTEHPDTLVLDIATGFDRDYRAGAAYGDYFAASQTMFPVWQRSDALEAKAQIYAIRINEVPKAYPIETLIAEQVVNDVLGETAVVLLAPREIVEVEGTSLRVGPVRYAAGSEVRAYERGSHTFSAGAEEGTLQDEGGRPWQVGEEALVGPDGETLPRLGGHLAYWFGWYAFFPNTQVYGQE